MKIYYSAGDRTPDLLNQRQTCYHLSQCGEQSAYVVQVISELFIVEIIASYCMKILTVIQHKDFVFTISINRPRDDFYDDIYMCCNKKL